MEPAAVSPPWLDYLWLHAWITVPVCKGRGGEPVQALFSVEAPSDRKGPDNDLIIIVTQQLTIPNCPGLHGLHGCQWVPPPLAVRLP